MRDVHKAAAYYEPLFRARVKRALKQLQSSVSVDELARAIRMSDTHPITRETIMKALGPAANVVRDATRQGGIIGAEKVRAL